MIGGSTPMEFVDGQRSSMTGADWMVAPTSLRATGLRFGARGTYKTPLVPKETLPFPLLVFLPHNAKKQRSNQEMNPDSDSSSASLSGDMNPQQLQQQEMAVFEGVDFVRLRRGRAYLHAAEDGRSVCLDPRRASHNTVWAVTPRFCSSKTKFCVLLRGAYGRYLGAPDAPALGSRSLCPCSSHCRAAAQRDFDKPEILAILWRVVAKGGQGTFQLLDASGRYLLANPRCLCLLPCRPGVSVSTCRGLCKASQWAVELVPRGTRPENPIPRDSLFARVCPPLPRLCVRWFSEREIRYVDADGTGFSEESDRWPSTQVAGRTTADLKRHLVTLLGPNLIPKYTLCVRAGLYGQPTPLAINLPRSREPLDIMLFQYAESASAGHRFIYPDVNAVAEAAARDEAVA